MNKFGFILLTTCLLATALCVELAEEPKDLLQETLDKYHANIQAEIDEEVKASMESFNKILGETQFMCTGGLDPVAITKHQYLEAFKKGPCNPAVVLPGIGGSKLRVEIDCKKFKEYYPSGFHACGWRRCLGL